MRRINLFYKYRINDKFPCEIFDILKQKSILNYCMIETYVSDSEYLKKNTNIEVFDPGIGWSMGYEKLVNWNDMAALDRELLELMLPYESMAIQLGTRRVNYPVTIYENERRNYLTHLRFWNHVFIEKKINAVYFATFPHNQHDYVIYALAKVKHIPIMVAAPSSFEGYWVYGNSLENMGKNIGEYYKGHKNEKCICLEKQLDDYYKKHTLTLEEVKKYDNPGKDKNSTYRRKYNTKDYFKRYFGINVILKSKWSFCRSLVASILKYHSMEHMRLFYERKWLIKNIAYYKRHFEMRYSQYNRRALLPSYDEKYIYFPLQFYPEETIMPRAGVFVDQYTSINLLARCARKKGIMVYVREHPQLETRDKRLYEEVLKNDNVRLIKSCISPYDITYNSLAVATQNGTCILEAALMGKPSLVFGEGYLLHEFPGLFEIRNEAEGDEILTQIVNGSAPNKEDVKLYFYAIQNCAIKYPDDGIQYSQDAIMKNAKIIESLAID